MPLRRGTILGPSLLRRAFSSAGPGSWCAFFLLLGLSARGQDPKGYTFVWTPSQAQASALLAEPEDLPPRDPVVSLKLALPGGLQPTGLEALEESWAPCPRSSVGLKDHTVVSLGPCSSWRGIPYQELLLSPLKPSPSGDGAFLLQRLLFRVDFAEDIRRQFFGGAARPESRLFLNPWDVESSGEEGIGSNGQEAALSSTLPPAFPAFRISVSHDGIYRLNYTYLTSHGLNPTGTNPNNLHLCCRGVEIPIVVEGPLGSNLVSTNAVVFYGQKLSIKNRDVWNGGDFTDTNVYWLYVGTTPGLRMTVITATPIHGYGTVSNFQTTVHAEQNSYFNIINHYRPNRDLWYWGPALVVAANPPAPTSQSYTLTLPHPVSSASSLTAVFAGFGAVQHAVEVTLNGVAPSTGGNPATWTGTTLTTQNWTFGSGLIAGANTLTVSLPGFPDHVDAAIPDYFETTYTRTFDADSGALLFTAANANAKYSCPGYGTTAPYILNLSYADASTGLCLPRNLTLAFLITGTASFEMPYDAGVSDRAVALSNAPLVPDGMTQGSGLNLSNTSLGTDLLVVSHLDFVSASPTSAWQRFLARRSASMQVLVVDVQDVYDNFSYGIFDPTALRTFLTTVGFAVPPAQPLWAKIPKYILLLGDGSYDYKNYKADATFKDWVPTMMFEDLEDTTYLGRYASDAWFADWNGDGYPDAAVGRIAVRSFSESEGVLNKILAYEDQDLATATWHEKVLYVADETDASGTNFETYSDFLASTYTQAPWGFQKIYYGQPPYNGSDPNACAADIRSAFPSCALLNFNGHGGFQFWAKDVIFSASLVRNGGTASDVDLLIPSNQLPFVLNCTCYTAAFDEVGPMALAEDLVKRSDRGAIASSGLTTIGYPEEEEAYTTPMFDQAFGMPKVRIIGDLVEAGRFHLPASDVRAVRALVLLGDPSLRLPLPAPAPPLGLSATGANSAVSLTWSAPAQIPSAYNVYRSSDLGATWSKVTASPLPYPATAYTDPGLTNGVTYAYYLTSLDSGGFEGPPSADPAPSATPTNPNPPAPPTGLSVSDTGTGSSLTVIWAVNSEPDLSGYTLYWGTTSGVYTSSQAFSKNTTSALVSGLVTGTAYYFALKASNTSGKTSGYSAEAWGRPSGLKLAIRPPAMITDLKVTRSGADLVLTWTEPVLDVGGAPVVVTQFKVYRVSGAYDWDPNTVSHVAPNALFTVPVVSGQTAYAMTDTGAVSLPDPLTYLVLAIGAQGDASPASNPPPSPVLDLRVTQAADGTVQFSFSPVTTNILGQPDPLVLRYRLQGFYPMTASSDHVRPPSPVLDVTIPVPLPSCGSGAIACRTGLQAPMFFTVVAVDNRGNTSLY